MNQDQLALVDAVARILADHSTRSAVFAAEEAGWNGPLWHVLAANGFASISVPEKFGGSGGDISDACLVLREIGRAAAALPFAEHALTAGWMLAEAGLPLEHELVTVAAGGSAKTLDVRSAGRGVVIEGVAKRVAWASHSQQIVVLADVDGVPHLLQVPTTEVAVTRGRNLAMESRDDVVLSRVILPADRVTPAPPTVTADTLQLRTALSRAALIAGALERVSDLTRRYTSERKQFGRPIAHFQAVQRHVVRIAEQSASASMAVEVTAANSVRRVDLFEVAAAKIVASQAAASASAASHQAHGAIGMTKEYDLGHLTRRLWSWEDEGGSAKVWARRLGTEVARAGADALWPRIATGLLADSGTGGRAAS